MTATPQNEMETEVQVGPEGLVRVVLHGRLDAQTVPACWRDLERGLHAGKIQTLEVDAGDLQVRDSAGLALLQYVNAGGMTPGAAISVRGLKAESEKLFRGFTSADYRAFHSTTPAKCHPVPEEVGNAVRRAAADLREQVTFLGVIASNLLPALMNRKRMRWPEVLRVFELAGANAVPITSLISLLVGLVIAFESVQPLAKFGAQIYVPNMIGLMMVRELGPLLAAIMLAGRSGSAFAAELGTMKVNEELNALETFGLDPVRFLVVQRLTAGILLTPLLTFYATFVGILGGILVTLGLGFPLSLIFHQIASSVHLRDVALAAAKGVVFGAIVSAVGCLRGLQTREGPSAVGVSTTRAVVTSILLIVIADTVFSVLFYFLTK
jgi:phospholipid/cholesterol/gamma-HCH transport system permease protein